jgi:hypothetical protein
MPSGSSVFKNFDSGDIVAGRIQNVSSGVWTSGAVSQSLFYVSTNQITNIGDTQLEIGNGAYYWDVYDKQNPDSDTTSEKYFSIAYGHAQGSGSGTFDVSTTKFFPTKATYTQYKNILLSPEDNSFSFASGSSNNPSLISSISSNDIYVINFCSAKFKERLDAGQFEMTITGPSGSITIIDDSRAQFSSMGVRNKGIYNMVSGSLDSGVISDDNGTIYNGIGLFYPTVGIVVLNPSAISRMTGLPSPVISSTDVDSLGLRFSKNQAILLYGSVSQTSPSGLGISKIISRSTEYIPTRHYFVRVKNQEFNYSNNPSFIQTGSFYGQLKFPEFSTDPRVYITTVGLYNENNDLLAVAKLSQPLLKSFDTEALIKVQLSW